MVAGGPWQRPLVEFLKNKGHTVHVVNPVETETTRAAHSHIAADVNDTELVHRLVARVGPRFITSDQADIATMAVAKLSERLGLPGNPPAVVERFTNKQAMYDFAKEHLPVPPTATVHTAADLREFIDRHRLPVAIKPADATNSRGFRCLDSTRHLEDRLTEVRRFSRSGQVIAQTFIQRGSQVTLDGVCSGGKHKTLAVSVKGPYFLPGLTSFVRYPANICHSIIENNDAYVEQSGLRFGLTHAEYIIDDDNHWLIEIAARGAGAGITDTITPWTSGVHPYEILHRSLVGEAVDVKALRPLRRPAILQFYHEDQMANCNPEKIMLISKIPGVAKFFYDFRGHQHSSDPLNPRHSMGIYLAETNEELDSIIRQVGDCL